MLKFVETEVVFREFPGEITLAINLSNCPNRCPGCHSPHLQTDCGTELTEDVLDRLITEHNLITCVGLMGGDNDTGRLVELAKYIRMNYPDKKIGWYSGRLYLPGGRTAELFDYVKLGQYIEERGPIDKITTNQRMYKREDSKWEDITYKFWESPVAK